MIPETSVPDELTTDTPRAAEFTTSTQAARLFLLLSIVFLSGFLGWLHDRDLGRLKALKAQGHTTLARVVGKHTAHSKSTTYYLDFTFDGDGIWVNGAENVGENEYTDTQPNQTIPLTFLPSYPQTYELGTVTEERIQERQRVWLWGEFGFFACFGLLLFGTEATRRRHLSLLRDGSIALGIVTDRSMRPPQGPPQVKYQFATDGKLYSEKVCTTHRLYEQAEIGQALTVLYDPAHPAQSIPYRMLTDVTLSDRGKTT